MNQLIVAKHGLAFKPNSKKCGRLALGRALAWPCRWSDGGGIRRSRRRWGAGALEAAFLGFVVLDGADKGGAVGGALGGKFPQQEVQRGGRLEGTAGSLVA